MNFKTIIIYSVLAALTVFGWAEGRAADVPLQFDPVSGATGYRIEMSTDLGTTWGASQDTEGQTTHMYIGAPEDTLVLFRVAAYTSAQDAIRLYSGAWYDHRLLPINTPSGTGIQ